MTWDRRATCHDFYVFLQIKQHDLKYWRLYKHTSVSLFSKTPEIQVWRTAFLVFVCKTYTGLGYPLIKNQKRKNKCNSKLACNMTCRKMFSGLRKVYMNSRALIWYREHICAFWWKDPPIVIPMHTQWKPLWVLSHQPEKMNTSHSHHILRNE